MKEEVRHRLEWEGFMWTCIWCGFQMRGAHERKEHEPKIWDVPASGPPCTLGVQVADRIQTEDKLS